MLADTAQTVLAADAFVKVGFIFDPRADAKQITKPTARQTSGNTQAALLRFFVNGVELPAFLSASDIQNATSGQAFPTAFMCPVIAHMNTTGSTPGTTSVDWIGVGQEANS